MAFEDKNRFETLVFQVVGERQTANGPKKVYRQLGYKKVEYDGNPAQVIETVAVPGLGVPVAGIDNYGGQIIGFEFVEGRQNSGFALGEKLDPTTGAV